MRRRAGMVHLLVAALAIAVIAGCGLRDAMAGDGDTVARAGDARLTVDQLVEMLAPREALPVQPYLVERWAWWWVGYALLAERLAAGDSLLDSATVLETRWPDVRQVLVDGMYARMAARRISVTPAVVESAFRAGELRVIDHLLIRAPEGLSQNERAHRRHRADSLRSWLLAGGSWAEANRANEDPVSRSAGGRLGVVTRGVMEPAFDEAAFALAPGGIAPVTETPFGYHVIRRPPLAEVRDAYTRALRDTLFWRMRDAHREQLTEQWDVELVARTPELLRLAADEPNRNKHSQERIGRYRGGEFTVADFIRWLQVLSAQEHLAIAGASDAELREFAQRVIRYELEWLEAKDAEVALPDSAFAAIKRRVARDVEALARLLAVDSVQSALAGSGSNRHVAAEAALGYLRRYTENTPGTRFENVPPFLADKLRNEARWRIRYDRIDRVLERIRERRARTGPDGGAP